jgi:hypothetical protein
LEVSICAKARYPIVENISALNQVEYVDARSSYGCCREVLQETILRKISLTFIEIELYFVADDLVAEKIAQAPPISFVEP